MKADDLYSPFPGKEGSIAAALRLMRRNNVTIDDALAMYEEYMDAIQASMTAVTPEYLASAAKTAGQSFLPSPGSQCFSSTKS